MASAPRTLDLLAAGAGVAAAVLGAGLGELTAAVVAPSASPFAVIGGGMIDIAPPWGKDLAISLFGTNDKAALLVGIAILLLAVAAAAGVLERRRPPWGRMILAGLGVVGAVVSMTRADADVLSPLPSFVAGAVAVIVGALLIARLRRPADAAGTATAPETPGPPRRNVRVLAGLAVVAGALAAVGSAAVRGGAQAATVVRSALRLPTPATTTPVPATAELGIDGLAPVITPSADFYRIDTALVVPQVDLSSWSLRIHGLVEEEVVVTWDDLVALPQRETVATLV